MINARELQIGNWVIVKGKPTQVNANHILHCSNNPDNEYERIELTPKLLSDSGFVFQSIGYNDFGLIGTWYSNGIELNGYEDITFGYEFGTEGKIFMVEYAHQLQNLHYSLTGNELFLYPTKSHP